MSTGTRSTRGRPLPPLRSCDGERRAKRVRWTGPGRPSHREIVCPLQLQSGDACAWRFPSLGPARPWRAYGPHLL